MTAVDCQENLSVSTESWSIETASWRDYFQLSHLDRLCFHPEDIWPFWDIIGILTLPGMVRLKAVINGSMVGFIGGERDSVKKQGWVTTLSVLPGYRRRGIALALLSACESQLGMPVTRLSVRESNTAAIHLYQAAGYALVDQRRNYYAGGETALIFEKRS